MTRGLSFLFQTRKIPRSKSSVITPGTPRITETNAVASLSAIDTPVDPESRFTAPSPAIPHKAEIILVRIGCLVLVAATDIVSSAAIPINITTAFTVIFNRPFRRPPVQTELRPGNSLLRIFFAFHSTVSACRIRSAARSARICRRRY